MAQAGVVWMDVVPVLDNPQRAITRQLAGPATAAGRNAGGQLGRSAGTAVQPGIVAGTRQAGQRATTAVGADMESRGRGIGKRFGGAISGTFGTAIRNIGGTLAAMFAVQQVGAFFQGAITGASDLGESLSKTNVVFDDYADQVIRASKTAASAMGLSQQAYLENASTLGNLLVSLDIAPKKAAGMSQQMLQLAGDMASFNNASPQETLDAIRSGLVGETEPLKRFGVNMNETTLKAQALKMGLIDTTKTALNPQQKALAAQALIMAQTKTAQGDFARTSGGLANQQRILAAQFDDVQAKLGKALLPVITRLVTFVNSTALPALAGFGGFLKDNAGTIKTIAGVLVGLTAAIVAYTAATKIAAVVTGIIRLAQAGMLMTTIALNAQVAIAIVRQWALNIAQAANPVGIIVVAIMALVAAIVLLWTRSETFRSIVLAVWGAIKTAVAATWGFLKMVFIAIGGWLSGTLAPAFRSFYTAVILPVWNGIKAAIGIAWIVIKAIFTAIRWYVWNVLLLPFRALLAVVKFVWPAIRVAIAVAWVIIQIIFKTIQIAIRALGMVFRWLWLRIIRPVWLGIRRIIAIQWAAIRIVFTAIVRVVRAVLGAVFRWLWINIIRPVWNGIKLYIRASWLAIRIIFAAIRRYIIGPLASVFRWIWRNVISPVWNGIRRTVATVWNSGIKPVFTALWRFVRHTIPNAFRTGVDAVRKAWAKVRDAAKKPVSFVLRTVIKKGIVDGFNKIAGFFGVDPVEFKIPKGFRRGGAARGQGSSTSDSIPAWLSNNEHVWTAREVAGAGGHGAVERMRAAAADGLRMPLARGGRVVAFGKWLRKRGFRVGEHPAFGGVAPVHTSGSWHYRNGAIDANYGPGGQSRTEMRAFDRIIRSGVARKMFGLRSIWRYPGHYNHAHFDIGAGPDLGMAQGGGKGIGGFFGGLFGKLTNPFKGLLDKVRDKMGDFGQWGGVLTASMKKLISGAWQWVKAHNPFAGLGEGEGDVGGARRWAPLVRRVLRDLGLPMRALQPVLSRINQESGGNPRAVNNWDSNARRGTPSKGLMQTIGPTFDAYAGKYRKLGIFNPLANIYAAIRYARARYGRGWIAKMTAPGGYDNGGTLYPGQLAANYSRRPEHVLTDQRIRDLADRGPQQLLGTMYFEDGALAGQVRGMVIEDVTQAAAAMRRGRR